MIFPARKFLLLLLALTAPGHSLAAPAQDAPPSEYAVKAAFLYNFAKFIEWPAETFSSPNAPFTLGVFGENPFGDDLERTVKNRAVNGRPFAVKQINSLSELKNCQILFISSSERRRFNEILKALDNASVLTVSDTERFIQAGGMINFFMENNKVRFEINDQAAKRAGLRISSKLLNLARRAEREAK